MSTSTTFSRGYDVLPSRDAAAPQRKGMLKRFLDRLVEARMRQADRFIRQHSHLLPRELEEPGWKVTPRSEDSLPFGH